MVRLRLGLESEKRCRNVERMLYINKTMLSSSLNLYGNQEKSCSITLPSQATASNSMQMQAGHINPIQQPVFETARVRTSTTHGPFVERFSHKMRVKTAETTKEILLVYAAFLALSALRSRLLLAASGPLSVSRSQSHQTKELE